MPPRDSRQKALYYKRAVIVGEETRTLSEVLSDALGREAHPFRRAERRGEKDESVRVMNSPRVMGQMLATSLIQFTEGTHQLCVRTDPEDLEFAISQLPPGEKEQFVESTLFLGVQGHHVILLQSSGLRSRDAETHLNWLLREHSKVISADASISLQDQPSKQAREKLGHVRSVTLRAPVPVGMLTASPDSRRSIIGAAARQILEAARSQGIFLEELRAEHALALEDLEIVLQIKRTGRGTSKGDIIDDLAYALRNADDDVFELQARSGRYLKSGELKLSTYKTVQTINGLPLLASVTEKMHEWLAELLEDRQVSEV